MLRRVIEYLPKVRFALPHHFFGPPAVLDIDARCKPLQDVSAFVA